jgi:hemolysin activation/secretion protein
VLRHSACEHRQYAVASSLAHFRDIIRQAENNCIGVKGIKAIHTAVQNRLISHGFITTRVLIPEQNLHKGTLTLRILPGRVSDVIIQDQSGLPVHRWNNVPQGPDDLLDLRGLEQGLENLQRIPGSQASIRLVPGKILAIPALRSSATSVKPGDWAAGLMIPVVNTPDGTRGPGAVSG